MTLFIVTVLSLLTWLPIIIRHELQHTFSTPGITQSNAELLTELLQLTNSLINPIVYVFRMKEFREALWHVLFRCSRIRRVHPTSLNQDTAQVRVPSKKTSEPVQTLEFVECTAGQCATGTSTIGPSLSQLDEK